MPVCFIREAQEKAPNKEKLKLNKCREILDKATLMGEKLLSKYYGTGKLYL